MAEPSYISDMRRRRHGQAWVALALSLGAHVADEAANDFLEVYNPAVAAIRARVPWLPLPVFTFDVWLAGLIAAVALLLWLSIFVFRGHRWTLRASYPLGVLMLLNGLGHFAGSLYLGRPMPGVWSSPLLVTAAVWLMIEARRRARQPLGAEEREEEQRRGE